MVLLLQVVSAAILASQLLLGREVLTAGIDAGGDRGALDDVAVELVLLVVLTGIGGVISTVSSGRRAIMGQLVERAALDRVLRRSTAARLSDFDRPEFHDRIRRSRESAQTYPWQLAAGLLGSVSAITASIGIGAAVLVVEPLVLPVALLAYVPLSVAMRRNSAGVLGEALTYTAEDRERAYLQDLMTTRDSAAELRNYRLIDPLFARYNRLYDRAIERQRDLLRAHLRRSFYANVLASLLIAGTVGMVIFFAGRDNELGLADATVAAVGIAQLGTRMRGLASNGSGLFEAAIFLTDFFDFADSESESEDDTAGGERNVGSTGEAHPGSPVPARSMRLELQNVSFSYPGSQDVVLDEIDVTFEPGELVALVGPSGSGKTTLTKVIAGLYEPTSGAVLWNGIESTTLSASELAQRSTVVFQDFTKLELSARTNVAAADIRRSGDDTAVEAAALRGGIHETISGLRAGYDTVLSPAYSDGVELSEGQWQRVAIARVMFRPTPIVILDEPTASLDARSERKLLEELRAHRSDQTVLLVTHRIANAAVADRVLVIEDGRLSASGTPAELLESSALFAEFARLQGFSA